MAAIVSAAVSKKNKKKAGIAQGPGKHPRNAQDDNSSIVSSGGGNTFSSQAFASEEEKKAGMGPSLNSHS